MLLFSMLVLLLMPVLLFLLMMLLLLLKSKEEIDALSEFLGVGCKLRTLSDADVDVMHLKLGEDI